jgi:hypothetical protein
MKSCYCIDRWFLEFFILFTLFYSGYMHAEIDQGNELRLVISAGSLVEQNPYQAFYNSRIFIGEKSPPFSITNADARVFETKHAIFFSQNATFKDIVQAANVVNKARLVKHAINRGIMGFAYRAFPMTGIMANDVQQYLAADSQMFAFEERIIDGKTILAFSKDPQAKFTLWPKSEDELKPIPAVIISNEDKTFDCLVTARLVGDMSYRFGLVDKLIKKKPDKTALIEMGTNYYDAQPLVDFQMALAKRQPAAVFLGINELKALAWETKKFLSLPLNYPIVGHESSRVNIDENITIRFWSIADEGMSWPFDKLGKPFTANDALIAMKEESDSSQLVFNVVKVFSQETAKEIAKSINVDLVLLLESDSFVRLPRNETIEINNEKFDTLARAAPIFNISDMDVSEIIIFKAVNNNIKKISILRHAIIDKVSPAVDVASWLKEAKPFGLPDISKFNSREKLAWTKDKMENVLGGIMLSQTSADVAIFDSLRNMTPILDGIPFDIVNSLFKNPSGGLFSFAIKGKQLKKISKLSKNKTYSQDLIIYGIDNKLATIGGRKINDNEYIKVVVSEDVLRKIILPLSVMGVFDEEYASRAQFIETISGDLEGLFFLPGPKMITNFDAAEEVERVSKVDVKPFKVVLKNFFLTKEAEVIKTFIDEPEGHPHHVVTFDLTYLDVSLSKNITNSLYQDYQKNAFTIGRGKVPSYLHLFLFAKMALNYDAPSLLTTLSGEIKYLHTDLKKDPVRDKAKFGLKFKLPWERSLFKDSAVVLAPIFNSNYETKLVPHFWSNPPNSKRTQRIDSLLGFNIDFTHLGFNMDIGTTMVAALNQSGAANAIDLGPRLNFFSKWSLIGPLELNSEISSYYLFALPGNTAIKKLALGIEGKVWLRLAKFYDFSVSFMSDFLVATLQEAPEKVAISSILGLTISYGRLFRIFG